MPNFPKLSPSKKKEKNNKRNKHVEQELSHAKLSAIPIFFHFQRRKIDIPLVFPQSFFTSSFNRNKNLFIQSNFGFFHRQDYME